MLQDKTTTIIVFYLVDAQSSMPNRRTRVHCDVRRRSRGRRGLGCAVAIARAGAGDAVLALPCDPHRAIEIHVS